MDRHILALISCYLITDFSGDFFSNAALLWHFIFPLSSSASISEHRRQTGIEREGREGLFSLWDFDSLSFHMGFLVKALGPDPDHGPPITDPMAKITKLNTHHCISEMLVMHFFSLHSCWNGITWLCVIATCMMACKLFTSSAGRIWMSH